MILKGSQRGNAAHLARHLLNDQDNEHIELHEVWGFVSEGLANALKEAEMIAKGTRCDQFLFSISMSPPELEAVPIEVFEASVEMIEQKLGLTGQPRAVLFHEKKGRRHAHVVWSRIDSQTMTAKPLPYFKNKLMDVSRELYLENDWDMPKGMIDHGMRNPFNMTRAEWEQYSRIKQEPRLVKAAFRACWASSDSGKALKSALEEHGYFLARGDRRGYVAVDIRGEVISLSRAMGVKLRELGERLGEPEKLPTVAETKVKIADRLSEKLKSHLEEVEAKHETLPKSLETRRRRMMEHHATQRQDLETLQAKRWTTEAERRAARLPKGLKAFWGQVTGKFNKSKLQNELEAWDQLTRDRQQKDKLIASQLWERQLLQSSIRRHREKSSIDVQNLKSEIGLYIQGGHQGPLAQHFNETRDLKSEGQRQNLEGVFNSHLRADPRQQLEISGDDLALAKDQLLNNPALILSYISHKEARFGRTDILRALAKRIDDPHALQAAAQRVLKSSNLVLCESNGNSSTYTTRDYQEAEDNLDRAASTLSAHGGFSVNRAHVTRAVRQKNTEMRKAFGGRLSVEQCVALDHAFGDKRLSCIVGLAGAGKSTLLATARDAWERQGVTVHGAALAGKAADGLESASGISSRTLASLETSWENGNEPIAKGDVLIIDEAGMVGTRQMARVAAKIETIGAKLVLIGDPDQLQPIEAGTPFRRLVDRHGAARLTEIHRQRDQWQKQASSDLATGDIGAAIEAYDRRETVTRCGNQDATLEALVENYVMDVAADGDASSRLAFAHRRKDVHALNQAIRAALNADDDPQSEMLFTTDTGKRAFAKKDRIVFTCNDKNIGVKNGMLGTVLAANPHEFVVKLDGDAPQTIRFDPKQFTSIDHGYAVTIHKSQGATVDKAYVFASRSMDKHLAYVAMTRHRSEMCLYLNERDKPIWAPRRTRYSMTREQRPSME
ncbi:AAA family ATPase [Litoreibacter sp.]|nr:AAA family ATPase [Litoreibacter sp.]